MKKLLKGTRKKLGQDPGSLIYIGDIKAKDVNITLARYSKEEYDEKHAVNLEEVSKRKSTDQVLWLNVDGVNNPDIISKTGAAFNIHPLILEDILNTRHRPKMEDLGDYLFVVLKLLNYNEKENQVKAEQVSLVIGKNYVVSFQEDKIDDFGIIRESLRTNKGKVRELGTDYLAYRILDIVIDNYFDVFEKTGEKIEALEEELLENPTRATLQKLYELKSEMILIRRAVWPLRETISALEKADTGIIKAATKPYLRDLYDHIIQLIDTNENYREMLSGMMDIYLSSISNRLNEVMKVLTIISTFFIPLNFIAGLYGMNFNTSKSPFNMPELNFYFGYPMVLLLMIIVTLGLLTYFKRKKWF
ncbi:MAG: magnesium/cobalt transporter CorA [Bacillota bacterium]